MSRYVIINSKKAPKQINIPNAPVQQTEYAGHALTMIQDICAKDSSAEIHIYGGDGSIFEAVNAVMASGHAQTATVVIHPFGTGNDFARNFKDCSNAKNLTIDLIKFNTQYAANEINLGFDCDVVANTQRVKKCKLFKGSFAYMIAILMTLFKKMGRDFDITVTDINGNTSTLQSKLLLCLIANGGFYGGGFHCAPRASLTDGYLEMLTVKKISRLKFLFFFLGFRKGKHIRPDGTIPAKYAKILTYQRVKNVTIRNAGDVCADGELFQFDTLTVSIEENAFRISVEPKSP
ncbi:MAG: hypothetical protein IJW46_05195 [Clostridia bacterium]|nr:hypothetical protein [Clostridia bacterium]